MMALAFVDAVLEEIVSFASSNEAFVPILVFMLGMGEGIVLISLFIPSTALFLAIGAAHSAAGGSFVLVWLAGAAGAVLGDIVSYAVGRIFKDDLEKVWPLSRNPGLFPMARNLFQRWGILAILGGKFTGTARPFLPIVAGAMMMKWPVFLVASSLSSLAWAGVFLAPGYGIATLWR